MLARGEHRLRAGLRGEATRSATRARGRRGRSRRGFSRRRAACRGRCARGPTAWIQRLQCFDRGVEAFGETLVQRDVAQALHLSLALGLLGRRVIVVLSPIGGNGHHARRGDRLPLCQRLRGRLVHLAGYRKPTALLEAADRIYRRHAHLAVDHAGAKADTIERDLRLHHGTLL